MFIIIPDRGAPMDLEHDHPTYERLVDIVADLPIYIPLPDTNDSPTGALVAWVGDDFIAAETRGELHRNIRATVLMWALGAPRQPYGGNVAITGIRESPLDGRMPVSLTPEAQQVITGLIFDIDMVLRGDPHPETPDALRAQITADAVTAAEMQYEAMTFWTID